MFFTMIVAAIETNIMTIEACNVIALRSRVIAEGDVEALREAELMVSEKLQAFAQAGFDIAAGVSDTAIRENFRTAIRANETRLTALRVR